MAALVVLVVLANGCSLVGEDSEPRALDDFPDDLFSTTTTLPPTTAVGPEFELPLYFVNGNGDLVRIDREVNAAPTVQEALTELLEAPTIDEESRQDETGEISVGTRLPQDMEPTVDDSGDTVEVLVVGTILRTEAGSDAPDRVRLVYAQIVCTVDAIYRNEAGEDAEINTQVRISDGEGQIPLQTAIGEVIDNRSVGPADFNNCQTAEEAAAAVEAEAAEEEDGDNGEPSAPTTNRNPTFPTTSTTAGPNPS